MLSKSRVLRHGNVVAQSIGGSAHNIANFEIPKPFSVSYETSKTNLDETFTIPSINQQKKVEPFDTTTGIISNSPEIIAFSSFLPVYDSQNQLNEFGQYLQTKQDSILIRSSKIIQDLLTNPLVGNSLQDAAEGRADRISEYLLTHSSGIEELLNHFSSIRKKLDFRYPIDINILKLIDILPPDYDLTDPDAQNFYANSLPLSVEDILNESSNVTNSWTPTKIWLQSCLELKEILANGMPQSFLSDGTTLGIDPYNSSYYDAFSLNPARSSLIKKFKFNEKQVLTYPIQSLLKSDAGSIGAIITVTAAAFSSNDINSSIFNEKIFSDASNIDESIAKLSHLLCKEYVYSTRMRSTIVTDYGYPFNFGGKNSNIWNYFIGQVGDDITDISPTPLGGGKSLVSLAQTVEPDGVEVLSFEDRYINDNVGTVRPNVVITPGTIYYLESSINPVKGGFDATRLDRYSSRLNSATNMLKMVKDDLSFKSAIPYSSALNKITKASESGVSLTNTFVRLSAEVNSASAKNRLQEDIKDSLSNPVNLLRHIEKNILDGSGLLRRSGGPKLWTNKQFNDKDNDVSALLISLALDKDDAELQSLLFLLQMYSANASSTANESNYGDVSAPADSTIRIILVETIMKRVKSLFVEEVIDATSKVREETVLSLNVIKQALLSQYNSNGSSGLKILSKIGALLTQFNENFDVDNQNSKTNGRFFLDQNRSNFAVATQILNITNNNTGFSADKKSTYTGIQKTLYLISIFKLCCLMVHLANPERLGSIKKPSARGESSHKITINKIKNSVVQVFLSASEANQGITKFNLIENDVYKNQSFGLPNSPTLFASANKVYNSSIAGIKKINTPKRNIRVFELPPTFKREIRIFDRPSSSNVPQLVALHYDEIIVKVENMLTDYNTKTTRFIDKFYSFVYQLKSEFTLLKNNLSLKSGLYGRTLLILSRQIGNPALARSLLSEEQLLLMRSKFEDYATRLAKDYISPIRDSNPHFQSLRDVNNIESMLPIEDVHLVAWNTFLKGFLASEEFVEGVGSNKKIISIGIPQKLHRRMRINSSNLSGLRHRNSLVNLCIYRVNSFLPDVIYRPKKYLFDLGLFPTRILKNFVDNGFSVSESEDIFTTTGPSNSPRGMMSEASSFQMFDKNVIENIPHLKNTEDYNFKLIDALEKSSLKDTDYSFLSDKDFSEIFDNHSTSFLMEEYLRLTTDLPFDEHKYQQYNVISQKSQSQFSKFVAEMPGGSTAIKSTAENFYNDDTLLTSDLSMIRSLILPKKFDRAFHIIFDPDDFEIDERTPQSVIEKYIGSTGDISSLSRNDINEPTFDKYYVALETYEGTEAS